jgi:hypothetical protein
VKWGNHVEIFRNYVHSIFIGFHSSGWPITADPAPTKRSVALDQDIAWRMTLPETGQNAPVVQGGKVFFSTMKEVECDAETGADLVAWCCDAATGAMAARFILLKVKYLRTRFMSLSVLENETGIYHI